MKLRFKKINGRGVEPIIAALLMLVITVFAFSLTYMATNTWISAQRSGPMMRLQERLVFEDVWFMTNATVMTNATGKYVCVYIRNIGKVEVTLYNLLIGGATYPYAPQRLTLPIGFGGWMNATFPWTVGTTYEVKVMTDRGGEMSTYATA